VAVTGRKLTMIRPATAPGAMRAINGKQRQRHAVGHLPEVRLNAWSGFRLIPRVSRLAFRRSDGGRASQKVAWLFYLNSEKMSTLLSLGQQ